MPTTVTPGRSVVSTDTKRYATVVSPAECAGLIAAPGMFVLNTGTADDPYYTFALLTGRTRRQWGMDMPTIRRFEVDTVVREIDGRYAIVGVPGAAIVGTFMTRPENVVMA